VAMANYLASIYDKKLLKQEDNNGMSDLDALMGAFQMGY
jgi:hypothetical protein